MRSRVLLSLMKTRKLWSECFVSYKNSAVTYSQLRQCSKLSTNGEPKLINIENTKKIEPHNLSVYGDSKYKVFEDKDAEIVFDVEEQQKVSLEELNVQQEYQNPYEGLNMERGVRGVYDIEDLVNVLQRENAKQIFVVSVPSEYAYVDYLVIVTGKSVKHMLALATFVRKLFKLKRHPTDRVPKIEGEKSKEWMALDLGNIALHIFSTSARSQYDLETLWSVGAEYDEESNQPDDISLIEQYNAFLADFVPADGNNTTSQNKTVQES